MSQGPLNWETFQREFNLSDLDETLQKANLDRDGLQAIYEDHRRRSPDLEPVAAYVAERLRKAKGVHSIRTRVKDPEHLIEKIIRKKYEKPSPTIDVDNYTSEITDLVGVQALHLLKPEWLGIHDSINETWDIAETPKAYYRRGDPPEVINEFIRHDCETEEHESGYRSVHYLVKCKPEKVEHVVEVQVRTVFEEGWSEIDHRVRYPHGAFPSVGQFLDLFNRLAGTADEMGTFLGRLTADATATLTLLKLASGELSLDSCVLSVVTPLDSGKTPDDVQPELPE